MDSDRAVGRPRLLWAILALALGLRLAALLLVDGPDLVTASESGLTAANWVAGHGYSFDFYGYRADQPLQSFMPPLFTMLVAAYLLSPWPAVIVGAVQVALSTLTVWLVYDTVERLAGRTVACVAAALVAAYPPFLILVDQPTQPVLNTFLLAAWLWATLRLAVGGGRRWTVIAGLALGLNVLSRPSAVGLLGVSALALAAAGAGRAAWRRLALAAVVMVVLIAPWLLRGWTVHGRPVWISTNGGFSFWNGNNPFTTGSAFDVRLADLATYNGEPLAAATGDDVAQIKPYPLPLDLRATVATVDELALDQALYRASFDYIGAHPAEWAGLLAQKLVSLWWFRPNLGRSSGFYQEAWIWPYQVLYAAVLFAGVAGLVLSFRSWRRYAALYGLFLYMTAVYVAYNAITRYRWEMEPFLLALAALALVTIARRLSLAWRPAPSPLGLAAAAGSPGPALHGTALARRLRSLVSLALSARPARSSTAAVSASVRPLIRAAFGVLFSALCLWLAFRGVRLADVAAALGRARLLPLLAAVAVEVLTFWAIAARWQRLFAQPAVPSRAHLFRILNVAQLSNAVLPGKAGPLLRAYLAGEGRPAGVAAALATVVGEKVVEGLSLFLLAVALLPFVPLANWLRLTAWVGASLLLAALAVMIYLAFKRDAAGRLLARLVGRWPGLHAAARAGLDALQPWRDARTVGALWAWSAAIWGLTLLLNQLLLWTLDLRVPPAAPLAVLVFSQIGVRLPSSPGSIGVLHYLSVLALSMFGVERGAGLSYGLLLHLITYLPASLLGLLFMARSGYSLRSLWRSTAAANTGVTA